MQNYQKAHGGRQVQQSELEYEFGTNLGRLYDWKMDSIMGFHTHLLLLLKGINSPNMNV